MKLESINGIDPKQAARRAFLKTSNIAGLSAAAALLHGAAQVMAAGQAQYGMKAVPPDSVAQIFIAAPEYFAEGTDGRTTVYNGPNSAAAALTPFLASRTGPAYAPANALRNASSPYAVTTGDPPARM